MELTWSEAELRSFVTQRLREAGYKVVPRKMKDAKGKMRPTDAFQWKTRRGIVRLNVNVEPLPPGEDQAERREDDQVLTIGMLKDVLTKWATELTEGIQETVVEELMAKLSHDIPESEGPGGSEETENLNKLPEHRDPAGSVVDRAGERIPLLPEGVDLDSIGEEEVHLGLGFPKATKERP